MTGPPHQRTRTRRHLLVAAASLAGAAGLAACGAGTPAPEQPVTHVVSGTVQFWQWSAAYRNGFETLARAFNQNHPQAQVGHTLAPVYAEKIPAAIASGNDAPDVYLARGTDFPHWATTGLTTDLSDPLRADRPAARGLQTIQPSLRRFFLHRGALHGMPWCLSTVAVAYDVDAVQDAGLRPPAELGARWDWQTFTDYARKLTPRGAERYGVDAPSDLTTGYYNWVVANGGHLWSDDLASCTADSSEFLDAIEQYMALGARYHASPPRAWRSERLGAAHASQLLIRRNVAMQLAGDASFARYSRAGINWDLAPVPYAPRTRKTGSIGNFQGLIIAPTCQNVQLAWAWISHLTSREAQDRIPHLFGTAPARLDSIDTVYLDPATFPVPKHRKRLQIAVNATEPVPAHPRIPWRDIAGTLRALDDVYDGTRAASLTLAAIKRDLTALLTA